MRRLPPLNAIRAFEATARLGGVQKASQALFVTHGAISHQVKLLENWLGVKLFDRNRRALVLNDAGTVYLKTITAALDMVEEGTAKVQHFKPSNTLGITTTHSIATKWLMDKLPNFSKHYPQIEIWLSTNQKLNDFTAAGVDIGLRMGQGPWPDLHCIPLMTDRLIVVCSPRLCKHDGGMKEPQDLLLNPLLHDQDPSAQWSRWSKENNIELPDSTMGPRYSSTDVMLTAAMCGQGMALVSEVLAQEDINQGRLVQALPQVVELGQYYWLVMSLESKNREQVCAFVSWISQYIR